MITAIVSVISGKSQFGAVDKIRFTTVRKEDQRKSCCSVVIN